VTDIGAVRHGQAGDTRAAPLFLRTEPPRDKGTDEGIAAPRISLAFLVLWTGGTMPAYTTLACATIGTSAKVASLWLVVDDAAQQGVPALCHTVPNVRVIALGRDGVASLLARGLISAARHHLKTPMLAGYPEPTIERMLREALRVSPKVIVEMKPAWMWSMRHKLVAARHTHVTATDLDIIFGNLEAWLLPQMVIPFDVVSWGFEGDTRRLFMRGQFTMLPLKGPQALDVLSRFTRCSYLSSQLDKYLKMRLNASEIMDMVYYGHTMGHTLSAACNTKPTGRLFSAEGCFSCALLTGLPPLRILFRPVGFSDHDVSPIYWSDGSLLRCAALCSARDRECVAAVHVHPYAVARRNAGHCLVHSTEHAPRG